MDSAQGLISASWLNCRRGARSVNNRELERSYSSHSGPRAIIDALAQPREDVSILHGTEIRVKHRVDANLPVLDVET